MNRDDIIRMARETGLTLGYSFAWEHLERFSALVVAAEREACARVCEIDAEKMFDNWDIPLTAAAAAIRARGEG